MKILLVGATGTLGTALHKALAARGHEVLAVARTGGDLRYDVTDPAQVAEMYDRAGPVDAVVSAAGKVPFKPVGELTSEDYLSAFRNKVLSQIELVRQGIPLIAERGSFTLITGVLAREPIVTGCAASMVNGAVVSPSSSIRSMEGASSAASSSSASSSDSSWRRMSGAMDAPVVACAWATSTARWPTLICTCASSRAVASPQRPGARGPWPCRPVGDEAPSPSDRNIL